MIPVVLLMGPTASGKSALAQALALRFGGEIVSADSAQIYRGMDIGTAKPDAVERATTPHHLLDLIDPTEAYSAARFAHDAVAAIAAIRARGRLPIVSGGTMLYFRALTDGLSALPEADPVLRAAIDADAAAHGWPALHAKLLRLDPATGARIAPTDSQRIQRALEVLSLTGRPLSALQDRRAVPEPLECGVSIALMPSDRARLHRAIANRFDGMLARGLVNEVRALRARYALDAAMPSMRCVGYRQVLEHLEGASTQAGLRDQGIAATRQLARRQLTWLRSLHLDAIDPYAADAETAAASRLARALDVADNSNRA